MTSTQPSPRAFHIGKFDANYDRVHESMKAELAANRELYRIDGTPLSLVDLSLTSNPSLIQAINEGITLGAVVLQDLTPLLVCDRLFWVPNVMYESGRADQVCAPVFRFCQRGFKSRVNELPFDLRTSPIHCWYDPTDGGRKALCQRFREWHQTHKGDITGHYRAQPFVVAARRVRDQMFRWNPAQNSHFHSVLKEQMEFVLRTAESVNSHLAEGTKFTLEVPSPTRLLDAFLAEVSTSLGKGDRYDTLSNTAFLVAMAKLPSQFQDELNVAMAERGVITRRLVLIGKQEPLDNETLRVLRNHEASSHTLSQYRVRYAESDHAVGYKDDRHCGMFRWADRRANALFKPRYERRGRHVSPIGFFYDKQPNPQMLTRFEECWRAARFTTIDHFLTDRELSARSGEKRRGNR